MKFKFWLIFISLGALLLSACSNGVKNNTTFENALINKYCNEEIYTTNLQKLEKNDDVIYTGLNVGLIARNCGDFNKSNVFFDRAEEAYKYDVDLQNVGKKGAKVVATTLINDTIVDYEGSLYERIMVNVYKGLNYMSLSDYANARVEFNRALMRQDKAKEYFAKEIEKNREELKKAKEDPNYQQNMNENAKIIDKEYEHLFEAFDTTKNFINPYASYLASVFFFMDNDFRKAGGLFREVAAINSKNAEITKQAKLFKDASRKSSKNKKKYIFVVYENGFGVVKDDFTLTLPFLVEGKIISASVALQTLKKREGSFEFIKVNGAKTSQFVDLDNIVATEFKINMPAMISKALAQTILKTTLNLVVANNDSTGGWLTLASSVATAATNKADVRSWRGLPKNISVAMVENKGEISLKNPQGAELFNTTLDKKKNALIIVRSFSPVLPVNVQIIEK
ncbi:hypothetical protein [Campylobacter vulpis]|uniref:hypothetical protein n=1 Tax=Campylobacter vulpis TaxID=1655500 RepID=UPI000C149BFD|nr:hypothetical protein [Campylobacter vulpis]MBS4275890.1 hypothetical protein [Campylobacter vulpis]MBS4307284.1 hypothetical protein [Campylobacter vulpis]MBS4330242.1 hypothetical protein [Campylobacter vulpis]MBS4423813.1 hypothetical protein [Campylobacter vulpis]PHY90882.1 hypothetical protein AA995_04895 [Campylobacter vulpis]